MVKPIVYITILLAGACCSPARSQQTETSAKALEVSPAPVKLDKNLRQALLKALTDLETESVEQRKDEEGKSLVEMSFSDMVKKNIDAIQKTTFSFDDFPGDDETPSEEKLQNSSFVGLKKYASPSGSSAMTIEKASLDDARSFHVHNVVVPDKKPATYAPRAESKMDPAEPRSMKTSFASSLSANKVIESITLKPIIQVSESLVQSASGGITNANSLIVPKPTASSPTVPPTNITSSSFESKREKPLTEEVKIFQAPLVAAFTVQQDEQGVPKSVVPIYRHTGDGQALTLQEQLDFKQKLLEQQLAELQQQQIQQTQFLVRQRQLYEQQLIQKQQQQQQQQQQLYFQEQARIKQLEEQAKIKQLEEQRLYRLHQQQHLFPVQKPHIFEQTNALALHQHVAEPTVHLQPSVALEVPNAVAPPLFRTTSYQEQLHYQQLRQPPLPQQQLQRLQQSFGSFSNDFQPPVAPASRFNRQEAFNAVGNFGFNPEKQPPPSRNTFTFNAPQRYPSTFVYNPYVQFRQVTPARPQTPAKQIQRLLYQSGVAGELGNVQGTGGHEDLNIVSKVLALNVGALPNKNYQQFSTSNRGKLA
ncbi:PREDICTED: putative mediator of RNA polymerase II transcription subunit 26 [Dinoponera quadriceps]|uniref:Mediator of RNA polymerase II transcription subunit 26 n=1 Tax=Dinoponera quadriceps TaxID=609295 RepID=A0A6P3XLX6_DINQU|nr:PREDICTED: putative mediator of RNA polymerase II transcription subunit 26 [Dinoponera quadriceps]